HKNLSFAFLSSLVNDYLEKNKFTDVFEFLEYLTSEDKENIEIYLPIKNYTSEDIDFLRKQKQTIVSKDVEGKKRYYCKVFDNSIDFYSICLENMVRIESIFNLYKFYGD